MLLVIYEPESIVKIQHNVVYLSITKRKITMTEYHGITVDLTRDELFDELGIKRLKESYMKPEENSPQERFAYVSNAFSTNKAHARRLYDYSSKHWLSYSTPILSFGRSKNGLPISCFLTFVPDTSEGLVESYSEVSWLSMMGGGVGLGMGMRAAGDKSTGVMPHLKTYDASSMAYRQGSTRRGSYAAYLDISHPDIIQFLEMRKPTGDVNQRCLNLHHGINVSDKFMQIIEQCMIDPMASDDWELIDPASGEVREVVSARYLWQTIIELRMMTGEPYLHFIDTSNRALPEFQKKMGLSIKQSNLCSEITLVSDRERTAVCCLSSLNLEKYDEWKNDTLFIRDVAEMLDNVLQYFIDNAPDTISRARFSAMRERSIGIGELGFHAYLQQHNVPFESAMAKSINNRIFKSVKDQLDAANLALGKERGEAPDAIGTGKRFSHMTAVAPNACQSKDNIIRTVNGNISMADLLTAGGVDIASIESLGMKEWIDLKTPVVVPTLDGNREVTKVWYNGVEPVVEIEFEDGKTYKYTKNHKLLVNRNGVTEWVMVGDLTGDEDIVDVGR